MAHLLFLIAQALAGVPLISGDGLHIIRVYDGCSMVVLELALVYGMVGTSRKVICLRTMHGGGVKSWNGVVYGTRSGTLFLYIIPFEVFRQATAQRIFRANALPSLSWMQARLGLIDSPD